MEYLYFVLFRFNTSVLKERPTIIGCGDAHLYPRTGGSEAILPQGGKVINLGCLKKGKQIDETRRRERSEERKGRRGEGRKERGGEQMEERSLEGEDE